MPDKFQNKYRISSARLQSWDYRWDAAYFVTICTKDKMKFFVEIEDGSMNLSKVGVIANVLWYEMKNRNNIELGEFTVMPNHLHGIIILNGSDDGNNAPVETRHALSLPQSPQSQPTQKTIGQQRFQNQGKHSLSSIVGGYKSAVTKHNNRLGFTFKWQSRFHDHIIRDEKSFKNITGNISTIQRTGMTMSFSYKNSIRVSNLRKVENPKIFIYYSC